MSSPIQEVESGVEPFVTHAPSREVTMRKSRIRILDIGDARRLAPDESDDWVEFDVRKHVEKLHLDAPFTMWIMIALLALSSGVDRPATWRIP